MLYAAAARNPSRVRVYNIDGIVSPGNHYDQTVNGQVCRFDGIHFSVYCASLLQPACSGGRPAADEEVTRVQKLEFVITAWWYAVESRDRKAHIHATVRPRL